MDMFINYGICNRARYANFIFSKKEKEKEKEQEVHEFHSLKSYEERIEKDGYLLSLTTQSVMYQPLCNSCKLTFMSVTQK